MVDGNFFRKETLIPDKAVYSNYKKVLPYMELKSACLSYPTKKVSLSQTKQAYSTKL